MNMEMNKCFSSREQWEEHLTDFQDKTYTRFRIDHSKTLKSTGTKNKNEHLHWSHVHYVCKFGGETRKLDRPSKKNTSSCRVGCNAFIKLHISGDGKSLEIYDLNLNHSNHEINEKLYKQILENRKLPPEVAKIVNEHLNMKCNKKLLQQKIRDEYGIHITLKDLSNRRAKLNNEKINNSLAEAIALLHSEDADVELLIESDDLDEKFKGLFFTTPDMRKAMKAWPEIIFLDGTYKLVNTNLSLMIFMVEDSDAHSEIIGVALLVNEDRPSIEWLLETFKKHHETSWENIKCFMTDKDLLERDVIKKVFPHISAYICLFHSLRIFKRVLNGDKHQMTKDVRTQCLELLEKMAKSYSQSDYEKHYNDFLRIAPPSLVLYFDKNWHSIRGDWTRFSMKNGNLNNDTNNRLESVNGKIKQVIKKNSTFGQFFVDFFVWLKSHNAENDYKTSLNFQKKTIQREGVEDYEQEYSEYLTRGAMKLLRDQFQKSKKVAVDKLQEREIDVTDTGCTCKFRSSTFLPCRHMIAIRKAQNLPIFSKEICGNRWTEDYLKQNHRLFRSVTNINCHKNLHTTRIGPMDTRNTINSLLNDLLSLASLSCGRTFDHRMQLLQRIIKNYRKRMNFEFQVIDLKDEGTKHGIEKGKSAATVPQKRKKMQPIIDNLRDELMMMKRSCRGKIMQLKTLETHWRDMTEMELHQKKKKEALDEVCTSRMKNLSISKGGRNDINRIEMAKPIKIRGCPRKSEDTTVKYKKRGSKNSSKMA